MNPFSHPGTHVAPSNDVEKGALRDTSVNVTAIDHESPDPASSPTVHRSRLARLNAKIEGLAGLEARGISRVLPEEKHGINWAGYIQSSALWFSMSLSIINLPVGLLGPLVFGLGWVDCVCIVIFANALSCCGPAYTAAFGCQSGHRTMVSHRRTISCSPQDEIHGGVHGEGHDRECVLLTCPIDTESVLHGLLAG